MNYTEYTQSKFNVDISNIVAQVKASYITYDCIAGIKRGGLIPGVVLSHQLGVPFMSFDIEDQDGPRYQGEKTLWVDDILDSGKTMQHVLQMGGDCAVLIWNVNQHIKPRYYGRIIDRKFEPKWINFWWEHPYLMEASKVWV